MPTVTISVKVDGKEIINEAQFDNAGECCAALNDKGDDLAQFAKKIQPNPPPDQDVLYKMGFEMRYTNPCCWIKINGQWNCLPCA